MLRVGSGPADGLHTDVPLLLRNPTRYPDGCLPCAYAVVCLCCVVMWYCYALDLALTLHRCAIRGAPLCAIAPLPA